MQNQYTRPPSRAANDRQHLDTRDASRYSSSSALYGNSQYAYQNPAGHPHGHASSQMPPMMPNYTPFPAIAEYGSSHPMLNPPLQSQGHHLPRLPPLIPPYSSGYNDYGRPPSTPSSPTSPVTPSSPQLSKSKAYTCEICNHSFTRAHDRKRHLSTHNKDPDSGPKCPWCLRHFSRGDALKRHLDNGCDSMPDEEYQLRQQQIARGTS